MALIRFLQIWNGFQPGDVADLQTSAELISGGLAEDMIPDDNSVSLGGIPIIHGGFSAPNNSDGHPDGTIYMQMEV